MTNPNYKEHPFIGAGKLFINTRQVGNCSDVKLSYNVEQKSLPNNMGGGGNLDSTDRISSVKLDLTCTNFSPENLAIALAASLDSITTAAEVAAEKLMMAANSFVDTEFMIDMTKANLVEVKTTATTPKVIPPLDVDGKPVVGKDGDVYETVVKRGWVFSYLEGRKTWPLITIEPFKEETKANGASRRRENTVHIRASLKVDM